MVLEEFLAGRVAVRVGDITEEDVDAIVNAANGMLLGGGGVDGAIHRVGGPQILEECRLIRNSKYPEGLPPGEAVITSGGNLKARHVIHTVGPIYGQHAGQEAELLSDSYRNSLQLARGNDLRSISFPSISTGAYRYPRHAAAQVSSSTIKQFLDRDSSLQLVRLVFFSNSDAEQFLKHHRFGD